MLPGFNEDVKFDGKVFHVQTEDKGKNKSIIETLVYLKGTIVAARRRSYAKELAAGAADKDLFRILEHQHKQIKALISKGQLDRINGPQASAQPSAPPKAGLAVTPAPPKGPSLRDLLRPTPPPEGPSSALGSFSLGGAPKRPAGASPNPPAPNVPSLPEPAPTALDLDALPVYDTDIEFDDVPHQPLRDDFLFSNFESFQRESPLVANERRSPSWESETKYGGWDNNANQGGFGGLSKPAAFSIEVIGSPEFRSGQPASVRVMIVKKDMLPAKNVTVTLRVVGPACKPVSFEQCTGPGGMVSFSFTVPEIVQGTASVILTADYDRQTVEKKLPVALR